MPYCQHIKYLRLNSENTYYAYLTLIPSAFLYTLENVTLVKFIRMAKLIHNEKKNSDWFVVGPTFAISDYQYGLLLHKINSFLLSLNLFTFMFEGIFTKVT